MAWGTPTNIGTAVGATEASISITTPAVPAGALIVVGAMQGGVSPSLTAVSDSVGNTYELLFINNHSGAFAALNARALSATGVLTYTKPDTTNASLITACYATNPSGAGTIRYDPLTFAFASSLSSAPGITSGVPTYTNELFFGLLGTHDGSSVTQAVPSSQGWAAPPNEVGIYVPTGANLSGAYQVNSAKTALSYNPIISGTATCYINIFSFYAVGHDWYCDLSKPVWSKPYPSRGTAQYLIEIINYAQYYFALTESADMGMLSFASYTPKNLARVAITEIPVGDMASVTIKEIRYDRGYS